MDRNDRNNTQYNDATGEIISWVIVFIFMFAFWPVGIFLLYRKLRSYAKPAGTTANRAAVQAAGASRQGAAHYTNQAQQRAAYNANQAQQGAAYYANQSQQGAAQNANQSQQGAAQNTNQAQQRTAHNANQAQQGAAYTTSSTTDFEAAARQAATQASGFAREIGGAARQAAREIEAAARQAVSQYSGYIKPSAQQPGQKNQSASQYTGYVKPPASKAYSYTARSYAQPQKKNPKKKKNRTRLEKKTGKFVSVILVIIAIALFVIGANTIARAAQDIWGSSINSWRDLWMGVFYFIGAFISFFSRNIGVRRYSRYKKYYAFAAGRGLVPISEIVKIAGRSERAVVRDVQAMINDGYFGAEAYIDSELECLVLNAEAAKEARNAIYSEPEQPEVYEKPENQYMAIILELRTLNDTIIDIAISDKIDRIEELTAKIFRIVEDDPSKLSQIRRFMNYYLPTTLKLLHSYALLEKQGIKGENITSAKENISRILDTLATGYEQQLDQLFRSDVIDIEADINVLENLMHQDGLTEDKPELKADGAPELKVMESTM